MSYLKTNKDLKRSSTYQCQKCLGFGHWTYECTKDNKYLYRPSRTMVFQNPELADEQEDVKMPKYNVITDDKYRSKFTKPAKNDDSDSQNEGEDKSESDTESVSDSSSSDSSDSNSRKNSDSISISTVSSVSSSEDEPVKKKDINERANMTNREVRELREKERNEKRKQFLDKRRENAPDNSKNDRKTYKRRQSRSRSRSYENKRGSGKRSNGDKSRNKSRSRSRDNKKRSSKDIKCLNRYFKCSISRNTRENSVAQHRQKAI